MPDLHGTSKSEEIVAAYRLEKHPEGGWFRETYRSALFLETVPGYPGGRSACTAIHFLIGRGDFSAFHRLRGEEVWIHLAGDPLDLVVLGRKVKRIELGPAETGRDPIAVVPAGNLQAAKTIGEFTLSLCIVTPGFEYADFSMPSREELLREHPGHEDLILSFTR